MPDYGLFRKKAWAGNYKDFLLFKITIVYFLPGVPQLSDTLDFSESRTETEPNIQFYKEKACFVLLNGLFLYSPYQTDKIKKRSEPLRIRIYTSRFKANR